MGFAAFMSSGLGRVVRIVVGAALVYLGWVVIGGVGGIILAIVGLVPFFAGVFDICVIGALFLGTPWRGGEVRSKSGE